jgi:serine/threonine protein kinase
LQVTIHQALPTHPNIVTLHGTFETPAYLLLLLEFVPGEDLFYFLEQDRDHYDPEPAEGALELMRTPPTPGLLSSTHPAQLLSRTRLKLIASMFGQMCEAVAACHDVQVFREFLPPRGAYMQLRRFPDRDIKPENFIVTDGFATGLDGRRERKVIVKLSDFGLSTTDTDSSDMDCGSAPYMSFGKRIFVLIVSITDQVAECRNNIAPTYRPRAADVWSLGIVLINMCVPSRF